MTININELRRLAQAATPGPWLLCGGRYVKQDFTCIGLSEDAGQILATVSGGENSGPSFVNDEAERSANARLIAAANPAVINELLDRLEEAESDGLEQARLNGVGASREAALMAKLEAAEKERDNYKFALSEYSGKTEWVQQGINDGTISPKYLGRHRADIASDLLKKAENGRDALRARIEAMAKLEPVAIVRINAINGNPSVDFVPGHRYLHHNDKLYLAPGAKGE